MSHHVIPACLTPPLPLTSFKAIAAGVSLFLLHAVTSAFPRSRRTLFVMQYGESGGRKDGRGKDGLIMKNSR